MGIQFIANFLYILVQYIAYTPIIFSLSKDYIDSRKCIFFAISCAVCALLFKALVPYVIVSNIFNILVVIPFCILFFKQNRTITLLFTSICSIISFCTNIFCLSFNIFNISSYFLLYYSFAFLVISHIGYKILKYYSTDSIINSFKSLPEFYFLTTILISSCITFANATFEKAYIILFIQLSTIFIILRSAKSQYLLKNLKLVLSNSHFKYTILKSINDDVRTFRHDYNNTLCSIGGYIALNDMNGLKKFYNKLTFDINRTNTSQMINVYSINEPSIYNLLVSKYNDIVNKDLNFSFYSSIDYKKLPISPYDFSRILGIFLDNAIEAAKTSTEKEIGLRCENNNNSYQIIIENSYINKDVDIEKIFLKGYSSKKIKSGLGLWEVSKLINTIPNISLYTEKDDNHFIQKLIIST